MLENQNKEISSLPTTSGKEVIRVEKGHWKKGCSGNPSGRKKGSVTKKTQILKTFCDDVLSGGSAKFKNELMHLRGKDFVNAYLMLMEFSLPKKLRTDSVNVNVDEERVKEVFVIGGKTFEW